MMLHLDTVRSSPDFPHNVPVLVAKYPELFDTFARILQLKIAPWMLGASSIGPRYTLFSEGYKRLWQRRNMNIFVWGMTDVKQCLGSMRGDGVIICVDNNYRAYYPSKPQCVTYAQLYPDAPSVLLGGYQQPERIGDTSRGSRREENIRRLY
eukprot:Tbor_TRINITY_DN5915_c0_g2::TRINITY_DN5915_c0_g2_i1::g.18884::m.18884